MQFHLPSLQFKQITFWFDFTSFHLLYYDLKKKRNFLLQNSLLLFEEYLLICLKCTIELWIPLDLANFCKDFFHLVHFMPHMYGSVAEAHIFTSSYRAHYEKSC